MKGWSLIEVHGSCFYFYYLLMELQLAAIATGRCWCATKTRVAVMRKISVARLAGRARRARGWLEAHLAEDTGAGSSLDLTR